MTSIEFEIRICSRTKKVKTLPSSLNICECESIAGYLLVCCGPLEYTGRVARPIVHHLISSLRTPTLPRNVGWRGSFTMSRKSPVSRSSGYLDPLLTDHPASQQWDFREAQQNCVLCVLSKQRGICLARTREFGTSEPDRCWSHCDVLGTLVVLLRSKTVVAVLIICAAAG